MPWLHPPEPLGAGGCTLACAARRPGPTAVQSERARGVYAVAAHPPPRCPRRGAQRSAGAVAGRVHPGMHRPRGRSREGAARLRRDGGEHIPRGHARHRPVPPSCVTTATASLRHRHRRTAGPRLAQFRPGFLRPLVLQRKVRYVYIHPPAFPRYSVAAAQTRLPQLLGRAPSLLPGRDGLPTPRYVDVGGRIGTARPTLCGRPLGSRSALPGPLRPLSRAVAVPRVLPGFSGFSQVSPPLYLQVCECRHSN